MFLKHVIFAISAWCIGVGAITYYIYDSLPQGKIAYESLLRNHTRKDVKVQNCQYCNLRRGVSKQMLYTKDNNRLQWRLNSNNSNLIFSPNLSCDKLVERFEQATFTVQEQLMGDSQSNSAKQLVLQGTADSAFYSYQTNQLEACNVHLARHIITGYNWPNIALMHTPYMLGSTRKMFFSLTNQPHFKAEQLQSSLFKL